MKTNLGLLAILTCTAGLVSASTAYTYSANAAYSGGTGTVDTTTTVNGCNTTNLCVNWLAGVDGNDPVFLQLVYTPFGDSGVATQVDSFGDLQLFCVDVNTESNSDTNCGSATTFDGHLTVTVQQTLPDSESGTFVDALAGTAGAGGTVDFSPSSFTLDGGILTYTLQQPADYLIAAVGSSFTSLQGQVIDNTAPEPATFGLLGAALFGFGVAVRKRKA